VSWPPKRDIVVRLVDEDGTYISAECRLGAHHGCPGGLRGGTGHADLICHCQKEDCECRIKLTAAPPSRT
jgi:hypothetical protein